MIICIDVGNTRTKVAVYENSTLQQLLITNNEKLLKNISKQIQGIENCVDIILSSVGNLPSTTIEGLKKIGNLITVTHNSPIPFKNFYTTPNTLGIDRIVLTAGAVLKYPKQNRLVIDAGTCITYDFVNSLDQYHGGAISPGIGLRYKSLNDHTAHLPLEKISELHPFVGNSTATAIHSGVLNGVVAEIEAFIEHFKHQDENLTVILTGGNSEFLVNRLKNSIFANPNFLLESLFLLYQHIVSND
ncbi:type III pantothenate kinase [Paenimyroides aestuarii]|uniref:Type III pantothenate kinase n=1 Tax=Paenimyroides aestuarii TaxID=2968490 RepID=A0ABY5NSQ9_9FLAO|nr:type III pantothenate kinase [Paenimyroides aestuarii]UUV21404.1 type III pantothenate kinase [Paenimyroides aestuarii]